MNQGSERPILRSLRRFAWVGILGACGSPSAAPIAPPPTPLAKFPTAHAAGGPPPPVAIAPSDAPEVLDLGGPWQVWLDREGVGLRDDWVASLSEGRRPASAPPAALSLMVPGPLEGDASTLDYDGIAFYTRKLTLPESGPGARAVLHFDQVNYACRAWLDGAPIGEHEGGYEPFSIDVTGRLRPGVPSVLVLRVVDPGVTPVDGLTLRTTPHSKESWYENFGGLLGPVTLSLTYGWSVRDGTLDTEVLSEPGSERVVLSGELLAPPDTAGASGDAPGAAPRPRTITLTATLAPFDTEKSGSVATLVLDVTGPVTPFRIEAPLPGAARWSPESPALHRVTLAVEGATVAERDVGFRTLSIEHGDFLLDGVRRTLKGVLWQPHATGTGGVAPTAAQLQATARAMKDAGFDLVRAHVRPAPPAFLDEADRIGLLVLEEPAIGWVEDDPGLQPRLEREVSWMVERDRHHPSIVLWGVLNELSGRAYRYADALVARVAQLDATRPVLEDSGAFLGQGHVLPPGASATVPMIDRHAYPPYPLPIEERDALLNLREEHGGLVFVSEFGHGTLLDTAAALKPFNDAGRMTNERIKFASWAGLARRSKQPATEGGAPEWWQRDFTAEAAQVQAEAAEDMLDVLRSNPNIDLLCYTQWQAANEESSAGLLGPWGEARPAYDVAKAALSSLRVVLIPERLSVSAGQPLPCKVVVVNDTKRSLQLLGAQLRIRHSIDSSETREMEGTPPSIPPGVTSWMLTFTETRHAGSPTLQVRLHTSAGDLSSGMCPVRFVLPAQSSTGAGLRAWTADDPQSSSFAKHWGFELVALADQPDVALIADPERLREAMTAEDWLRLWADVYRGGSAVVLVPGPAATDERRALGMLRGVQTFTSLPLPISIASAPGNFMARVHAVRDGDAVRLLGRGDEAFSPEGMLVDPPPDSDAHMVTLGWLGNRLGAPDVTLPFGRGTIRVIGLPLLRLVNGAVDPSRDEQLANIVRQAAQEARARLAAADASAPGASASAPGAQAAPWSPPPAADLERLQTWSDRLDQLVALGDRQSPFSGDEPRLPASIATALGARTAALEALFGGDTAGGPELLEAAVAPLWTEAAQRFLEREAQVMQAWAARVAAGGEQNWDRAYDVRQAWVAAVGAWFRGEPGPAQEGIDRAWELLR